MLTYVDAILLSKQGVCLKHIVLRQGLYYTLFIQCNIEDLAQDCGSSSEVAIDLLQSCAEPSKNPMNPTKIHITLPLWLRDGGV